MKHSLAFLMAVALSASLYVDTADAGKRNLRNKVRQLEAQVERNRLKISEVEEQARLNQENIALGEYNLQATNNALSATRVDVNTLDNEVNSINHAVSVIETRQTDIKETYNYTVDTAALLEPKCQENGILRSYGYALQKGMELLIITPPVSYTHLTLPTKRIV